MERKTSFRIEGRRAASWSSLLCHISPLCSSSLHVLQHDACHPQGSSLRRGTFAIRSARSPADDGRRYCLFKFRTFACSDVERSSESLRRLFNCWVRADNPTSGCEINAYCFPRWTSSYIVNVLFTLYIGIMKNPTQWTSDTDVALVKTLPNCFSKSCNTPSATSSFHELCASLMRAIDIMQRRSLQPAEASRPVALGPEGSNFVNTYNEGLPQELNHDIDFRFSDFFGMCGTSGPLSSMQMWPMILDETAGEEFLGE